MDNAVLVRRFERRSNLRRDGHCFVKHDRTFSDAVRESGTLNQLHDQCCLPSRFLEAVDGCNVIIWKRDVLLRRFLQSAAAFS